jgi:glycerophosphoryl diester phosphodiesterase
MRSLFFSGPLPRILAHRGLALEVDENTLLAFGASLDAGAQILETDVRATADGVAVLFHDDRLASGVGIRELTWQALQSVALPHGGTVPSLSQALAKFSDAKFNIDVKASDAIAPTVQALQQASATGRVLVASFSRARQRGVARHLPGVATSASALMVLGAVLAGKVSWVAMMRLILRSVNAVQIPNRVLGMHATSPAMVRRFHAAEVEVHVWTVNDETEMIALRLAGVDGIVTDRCDRAYRVFAL